MAVSGISTKRILINKANSSVVIITSVAAFVTVFSLVATKTLVSQFAYQNRVISAKRTAVDQLKVDITNSTQLKTSYDAFNATPQNAIGGDPTGNGAKDGSNTKIVLDALPSYYDFPALGASLETLITSTPGLSIVGITGTDDEVNQSSVKSSDTPQSVPMPFQLTVSGNYDAIKSLINEFEHSIRPFQIQSMEISGDQSSLTLKINAQTFYQPAKSLDIKTTVIK